MFISKVYFVTISLAVTFLINNVEGKSSLIELARELNLTDFVDAAQKAGVDRIINHEGYFTIFAPTNAAFENEKKYPNEDSLKNKMRFHVGRGKVMAKDVKNDLTVKTLLSKRVIRMNTYENGVITANGRPVVSTDHVARNGVIHIISEVMSSVYARAGSVVSELSDCCPQHSQLLDLIEFAKLYKTLDTIGPVTLLAPTNGAFAKLHPDFILHLKKNVPKLQKFLLGHVLPGTWYSAGLTDGQELKTLGGNRITVSVGQNGGIKFGKAPVNLADVTAGNGAVHSIDEVLFASGLHKQLNHLISSERKHKNNLVEECRDAGYTSFADALKETKMDKVVNHEGPFTIFAPSNDAFNNPKNYPINYTMTEKVQFHIARGFYDEENIVDEQTVRTLLSKRDIRFNIYENTTEKLTTANGRKIIFRNHIAHNGVIHELDSGMDYIYERKGTLLKEISRIPQMSNFVKIVKKFGLNGLLDNDDNDLTVLVPNNKALTENKLTMETALTLVKNHLVRRTWYSNGIPIMKSIFKSLGNRYIHVKVDKVTGLTLDSYKILTRDYTSQNGVFHEISGIIE